MTLFWASKRKSPGPGRGLYEESGHPSPVICMHAALAARFFPADANGGDGCRRVPGPCSVSSRRLDRGQPRERHRELRFVIRLVRELAREVVDIGLHVEVAVAAQVEEDRA